MGYWYAAWCVLLSNELRTNLIRTSYEIFIQLANIFITVLQWPHLWYIEYRREFINPENVDIHVDLGCRIRDKIIMIKMYPNTLQLADI